MKFTGERMIPDYNEGQEIYLEHMTRYFFASQFVKNKVVLDIACGSGYGSDYLLQAGAEKVIGIDISEETINYCKEKYFESKIDFLVGDVEKIPLDNSSVDVVISFETIEHVDEKTQIIFLQEVKRILKKDGVFVVSTPNSLVYPKGNKFHLKELNYEEFSNLLNSKFKKVEILYQDNVESSYVYSQENLEKRNCNDGVSKKTDLVQAKDSMYLIAVCQDKSIENMKGYTGLSNIKPYIQYTNLINNIQQKDQTIANYISEISTKDQEILKKDQEVQDRIREINFMESSKFWKIKTFYEKIKIPIFHLIRVIKNDGLFILIKKILIIFIKRTNNVISQIEIFLKKYTSKNKKDDTKSKPKNIIHYPSAEEGKICSIVIPHHNRHDHLKNLLDRLDNRLFDIIIVSGGSFAENCNRGATLSVTEKIIFMNDDTCPTNEDIIEICNSLNTFDVVGSTQVINDNLKYYGIGFSFYENKYIPQIQLTPRGSFFPSGFLFGINKKSWKLVEGFDTRFKTGYEDVDLGIRLIKSNLSITILDLNILHKESQSDGRHKYNDHNVNLFHQLYDQQYLKSLSENIDYYINI